MALLVLAAAAFARTPRSRWARFGPDGSGHEAVLTLVISPQRPDTVYVGLGHLGASAFRSTDGGRTWEPFARRVTREGLVDLAVDPLDPRLLVAANPKGVWRSRDGGATWRRIDPSRSYRVAVTGPGTYLAGRDCGLFRTTDDGGSWQAVIPCSLPGNDEDAVIASRLWVDPEDPLSVYALMLSTNGEDSFGFLLFRSADGGATWKKLRVSPSLVAVSPGDFRTLYAVDNRNQQILRSRDGGETWRTVHARSPYPDSYTALAVDAADPDTLYAGTFSHGVLRSQDGGATLEPVGGIFPSGERASSGLFTAPGQPGTVYAAGFHGGLFAGRFE
jgi:photosystem II stability/assembly factor-like uncharacterized protein